MLGSYPIKSKFLLVQPRFAQRWRELLLLALVLLRSARSLANFASIPRIVVLSLAILCTVNVPPLQLTIVLVMESLLAAVVTVRMTDCVVSLSCNRVLNKLDVLVRQLAILSLDAPQATQRICFATGMVLQEESKYVVILVLVMMMDLLPRHQLV
jgi:hypothetical protein